ncbi:DHA2 family efflux MFS transporter permease subunit [Corynebacterium sp. TA-R-1]|uniref:DHA2 family efflux MFS transporter permease subunit n=1 Tax=Corynebacterium stercoris TaxID=2943490 RepID=A0ABT1G3Z0_9CORY|nr:DHA2 family efflux MFS transporter permease subunit [Corynebacterium stercoris]MCP1387422.1 DHA2 family efflux MFS transporter permease subunit [Corynebacterium stercoris]
MTTAQQPSPWPALWAMMLGFFMILVDSTIVSVAIPAISEGLDATYNEVIWVNSAYLLAYAVPLLITGRMGDRYGPRTIYLIGLALFTLASLLCGLASSAAALIAARALQGLGGAMVTPQSMSVMIRTFSPTQRGSAMGVWGATAGLATVTGPLLGGVLTDAGGWPWIFFVNVPVGILGIALAWKFVPRLEQTNRSFDWVGTVLSAIGMFCLVFGIQEAERFGWDWRFWALLLAGAAAMAVFIRWQSRRGDDALVPLRLFANRNFALASVTIATVGFAISTFAIPWMIYVQTVQEYSPTRAALLVLPSGVVSFFLSPQIGKLTNTLDPKPFAIAGLLTASFAIGMGAVIADPAIDPRWMYLSSVFYGVGNAMIWGPLSMVATRNLERQLAGAGSSVYNTTRQIGAVIGSAAVAAMMSAQLRANLGDGAAQAGGGRFAGPLPPVLHEPFAQAMSSTIWLPFGVLVAGAALACCFDKTESWKS